MTSCVRTDACDHAGSLGVRSRSSRVTVATCKACGRWAIQVDGELQAHGLDMVGELIEAMGAVGERVEGVASRELREFAACFAERYGLHAERRAAS